MENSKSGIEPREKLLSDAPIYKITWGGTNPTEGFGYHVGQFIRSRDIQIAEIVRYDNAVHFFNRMEYIIFAVKVTKVGEKMEPVGDKFPYKSFFDYPCTITYDIPEE